MPSPVDGPALAPAEKPAFVLTRFAVHEAGAFGVLLQDGLPVCLTLERTYPMADHVQLVKIPVGVWSCHHTTFNRGGYETYEVLVPGHSRLLFHRGNVENDSEGCILLGLGLGTLRGDPAVTNSLGALLEFMRRAANRQTFMLEVRQP